MSPENELQPGENQNPEQPTQEGQKENKSRVLTLLAGFLCFVIVISPVYAGWHYGNVEDETNTAIEQATNDILLLDVKIKKEQEKNLLDFKGKEKKIEELTSYPTRIEWSKVIERLETVIRETTANSKVGALFSFNSYSLSPDQVISVIGSTNSYPAIADIIEALEASPYFKEIKFSSSSKSKEGTASLNLSFKLEEPEKDTDAPEKAAESDKKSSVEDPKKST